MHVYVFASTDDFNQDIIIDATEISRGTVGCALSEDSGQPDQSSQGTLWVSKDPKRLQAESDD